MTLLIISEMQATNVLSISKSKVCTESVWRFKNMYYTSMLVSFSFLFYFNIGS